MKLNFSEPILPLEAPAWAQSGHAQTILGHLLPSERLKAKSEHWRIALEGGDIGIAEFLDSERLGLNKESLSKRELAELESNRKTITYLFHGLGGSSDSDYIHRTARVMLRHGHSVVMYNHRGCGPGEGLASQPYHSGRAEDLAAVIAVGRDKFPHHRHFAVGFSLSANALLLLAAQQRGRIQPDAAIAVNAPINLGRAADLLEQGWNRIYDVRFMNMMRASLRNLRRAGRLKMEIRIPWGATLQEFDDLYTAPAGGFRDRHDYYSTCSAAQYLAKINMPTVILMSKNDPFVDFQDYASAPLSESVFMHTEDNGGHMGYLHNGPTPLGTRRWLDYALDRFTVALQK